MAIFTKTINIGHFPAIDPFKGQNTLGCVKPFHAWHPKARVFRNVFCHFGKRGSLEPEIHFHGDGLSERIDHGNRTKSTRRRMEPFRKTGNKVIAFQISLKSSGYTRTQHFDGDLTIHPVLVPYDGRMHLSNGCCCNGFAKFDKDFVDRAVELFGNCPPRCLMFKRRQPILQCRQFTRGIFANDIGPRCQELTKLHIRRTQAIKSV